MGRKKTVINWDFVDNHLRAHCDGAGIAGLLGIHPDTLYNACKERHKMVFSAYAAIKRGEGKQLLKAKQFELAMSGDKTLLVWLGKQYLDQTDKAQSTVKNVDEFESKTDDELSKELQQLEQRGENSTDQAKEGKAKAKR